MPATPAPLSRPAPAAAATREFTFTEASASGETPAQPLHRLARRLREHDARIIGLMVFGRPQARGAIDAALRTELGRIDWPVLWVETAGCDGAALAGVQAFALSGGPVEPVVVGGKVAASRYVVGNSALCWIGGSLPDDTRATPGEQTARAFADLENNLRAAGFAFGDLVRTWCYNRELLAWYDDFNRARSALYRRVDFRAGAAPASTGISAANRSGAALILGGLAVRPLSNGTGGATVVGSPLQCPAPAYGSAFSRAMEIDAGGTRRLLVSGTASIEPGGASAWQGDIGRQVDLAMRVVAAILESRGLGWNDATRAIAYFKSPSFAPVFDAWCREHGWTNPPCLRLHCDICRDDLLFEIELDAETAPPAAHSAS